MTQDDLQKLRAATNDAIGRIECGQRPDGPVNWADLSCVQAAWVITDEGEPYAEVTIKEASPECVHFQAAVGVELKLAGWPAVRVRTDMSIIGRTLSVKLSEGDVNEMETALFFQCGDWAVTQGICVFHKNACYKLTHVPSTACIPHCFTDRKRAENLARDLNLEVPKFKSIRGVTVKYHDDFKRALERNGIRLVPKEEVPKALAGTI